MTSKVLFLKSFLLISLIFNFTACNNTRQVTPYELDTDEVYKALAPNEEDSPNGLTFGKGNIPGTIFDYEINTDSTDVYVFFEKFTILDINPKINRDIFEFALQQLKEFGFVNDSLILPSNSFQNISSDSSGYDESARHLLDFFREEFQHELDTIYSYKSPFNIYFQIYPINITEDYVTYRESAYSYTGGAHGISISYLRSYSLKTGNLLTINDIITPSGLQSVRDEVVAHMAYSYPIFENISTVDQYLDSLNIWLDHTQPEGEAGDITIKDYPLPNPALTQEGLAFVYQMYELTPGSDGCPMVLIPYKDIKGCLNPPFEPSSK
ncbi:MAG: DUF3298 domain-containing protein [Muribaculaceae bacterium]|nr:DUF3298 domain-containing protein [Muribaculaceae bacterium]